MELSIIISVAGIFVSITVGFSTFYIADRRARRNRWQSAKATVLRDLSKSLGEGNVPDASVILATIRSVLREQNAKDLDTITIDEIADDLLRQITSDPFLDTERRKQLQSDALTLTMELKQEKEEIPSVIIDGEVKKLVTAQEFPYQSIFAGVAAGTFVSIIADIVVESLIGMNPISLQTQILTVIGFVLWMTIFLSFVSFSMRRHPKKK